MLCVFFLFSHKDILVDVLPVNQILLLTSPLHAFEVTNLLYREIVGLKLVSLLVVRKTLVIFFRSGIEGSQWLQLGNTLGELSWFLRSIGWIRKPLL